MKASGQGSVAAAKKAKAQAPTKTLSQYLEQKRGLFERANKSINPTRFIQIVARAVYTTPKLAACSYESILLAALEAATLGIEPGGVLGHAALVPYARKAQLQLMYRGMILLAYKHGVPGFKIIDAQVVYKNDQFEMIRDPEPKWTHKEATGDRGEAIGYYAYFILTTGGIKFEYMRREDVDAWAKRYSKSYNDSDAPWQRFFDPMALKTVLRKVLKYAPMSITLPQETDIEKIPVPVTEDTVPVDYEVVDDDVPEGESGESPTNKDTTSERNSQEEKPVAGSKEPTQPEMFE